MNAAQAKQELKGLLSQANEIAELETGSIHFQLWLDRFEYITDQVFHPNRFGNLARTQRAKISGNDDDSNVAERSRRLVRAISAIIDEALLELEQSMQNINVNNTDTQHALMRVRRILERFGSVAQRLGRRHQRRKTLTIKDEYDVQDLLHALLVVDFEDIRPEQPFPSLGNVPARIDFLIAQQGIGIETKKTRPGLNQSKVVEELAADIVKYKEHPKCLILVCFVYDPDKILTNPAALKDLERLSSDLMQVHLVVGH